MAVQISDGASVPHAANYSDLLAKLVAFATANGWTAVENSADKLILRGSGTTGTDAIYVGVQKYADLANDNYGWRLKGYTGYNAGLGFNDQPGALQAMPCLPLWNYTIPYWLTVSPRLIKLIAKVGTTYQGGYLGYMLPFATPNQYPYPLVVGGSAVYEQKYTGQSAYNSFFTHPFDTGNGSGGNRCALHVRLPSGEWYAPYFGRTGNEQSVMGRLRGVHPYAEVFAGNSYAPNVNLHLVRPALDGTYPLEPAYVLRADNNAGNLTQDFLGELEGVRHVSAFGNSAENIVQVGARNFLCVPNVFRASESQFFAVELA